METDRLVDEAWHRDTGPARLRELAAAPELARIVAARIGLPAELAEELARRAEAGGAAWTEVARALAAQPATPRERLARLAAHPEESVRWTAAVHRDTPKSALKALAADRSPGVRRALAAREELPRKVAAALLADESPEVRLTMARRVGARPEELRALAGDPDPRIRRVLAALGHGDAADLTDPDPQVRRTAVEHRGHRELAPLLPALARDEDQVVRELAAAQGRNHDPAPLALLAADPEPRVRAAAAANAYTPVASLTALAADPELVVLTALGRNRLAPPAALARLVDTLAERYGSAAPQPAEAPEAVHGLGYAVLGHPATPPESLRRLHALELVPYFHPGNAMDQPNWPADLLIGFGLAACAGARDPVDRAARAAIERAAGTEPAGRVVAAMIDSPLDAFRAAVANRHAPPRALAEFVRRADRERDAYHLDSVARNPATPLPVLLAWAVGRRRCAAMLDNPELPDGVLAQLAECTDEEHAERARELLEVRALRAAGRAEAC
ncbi:hypothetical protein [Kitasatospora camelliae]|uniref:Leucine rich repeat (LRR) protein n=1 Tax=Kitasatospora camelliae TaxID=3156397 RepID=A0AAU8K3C6_9ACTN